MSNQKESLSPKDPSSFSRPELVKVVHIHLNLDVNFSTHILKGSATLKLEKCDPSASSIVSTGVCIVWFLCSVLINL